jgi:hypothetical protein
LLLQGLQGDCSRCRYIHTKLIENNAKATKSTFRINEKRSALPGRFIIGVSSVVNASDEFLGFGVRIMEKPFAKLTELVPGFIVKRLSDKPVLGEFVFQSPRNLPIRRRILTVPTAQFEVDRPRSSHKGRPIQQVEDIPISPSHPSNWRGH